MKHVSTWTDLNVWLDGTNVTFDPALLAGIASTLSFRVPSSLSGRARDTGFSWWDVEEFQLPHGSNWMSMSQQGRRTANLSSFSDPTNLVMIVQVCPYSHARGLEIG